MSSPDSVLPHSRLPTRSCSQTVHTRPFNSGLGLTCFFSLTPSDLSSDYFSDVGSVEGLSYHRGWDMLYWTSYTTSTITRHTVDQSRWGAVDRHTVVSMSGDDHPRAFVLDECQRWKNKSINNSHHTSLHQKHS